MVASETGPGWRKVVSVETAVFPDATVGQIGPPDNVGPVPDGFGLPPAPANSKEVAKYFPLP